jgi:hypothetical protein
VVAAQQLRGMHCVHFAFSMAARTRRLPMSTDMQEGEVSSIEYVGPHATRPDLYEITVTLVGPRDATRPRLSLLFRPAEAMFLAHSLQASPPNPGSEDHVLTDIARLQT